MKSKQLVLLIVIAAVLGLFALLKNRSSNADWRASESEGAATLLPATLDTEAVKAVEIKNAHGTFTFKQEADGWKLTSHFGYPANMADLVQLVSDLADTKIAQTMEATPEQEKAMGVDEQAAVARLLDASGKELAAIAFGKKVEKTSEQPAEMAMYGMGGNTPVGRYVKLKDAHAIVANTFARVDNSLKDWMDESFIKIGDLKSATLSADSKPLWTVSRDSSTASLALLGDIPEGKEADSSKLSSIKSAFQWMKFNDVADPAAKPADIGFDTVKILTVIDFDGFVTTITLGKPVNGKQYIRAKVAWNGPADDKKAKENQEKADTLNKKLAPWTYEIGSASFDKSFQDFLKDKPAPKAEDTKKDEKPLK